MNRILLLLLLLFSFREVNGNDFAFNILGYRYEDSSKENAENIYQQVLTKNPLVNDSKSPDKRVGILRKQENKTGVFFISVLLLYVFAGIRLMFSHQFAGSFATLKNMNDKRKAQSETDNVSSLSFYALYVSTLGYICYYYLSNYKSFFANLPPVSAILICIAAVILFYFFKIGTMNLLAWTFDKKAVLTQYYSNVSVIYKATAIILFPLSILMLVSSKGMATGLLKMGILIFLIAMLFRYIKNIGLVKKLLTVHFLYFFMYLCAFEIMPLLLLFKWIR